MPKNIAVLGAGLFGCTAAIHLARAGYSVHLFDPAEGPMRGATLCNQQRLHRGYHYPRSPATGRQCRGGNEAFEWEYADAVIRHRNRLQIYAIARQESKTDAARFEEFMTGEGLYFHYQPRSRPLIDPDTVEAAYRVGETFIDYQILYDDVCAKLDDLGVEQTYGARETIGRRDGFDRIVVACYAANNTVLAGLGCAVLPIQYEVVEKPIVRLPQTYRNTGIVIMDGPFGCIDPYGTTGLHVMGHVKHAVWATSHGSHAADIPPALADAVDDGVVWSPDYTRFRAMQQALAQFAPFVEEAEHIGSMYTVRAVLADVEGTDARPTIVRRHDAQVMSIFSGKLGTAVDAAKQVLMHLQGSMRGPH